MKSARNPKADGRARFVVLMAALSMLTATVRLQDCPIATAVCASMDKVHQVQHDADQMVQFSRRLYRFYRLSQEKPSPRLVPGNSH